MLHMRLKRDQYRDRLRSASCAFGVENDQLRAHIGRMAREKYETMLRCPVCDRTGLADMSDDKSHKIGDYDTRIEAVTQGFEIKGKDVICSVCQVSAL